MIESVQFSCHGNQVTMFVFLDTDDSQVSRLWSKQRRSHPESILNPKCGLCMHLQDLWTTLPC